MITADPAPEEEKGSVTLEGYVVMLPYAVGSKSEGMRPVLLPVNQKTVRICFHKDDPFSNPTLRPLHLKYCRLQGCREGLDLIVNSIEQLEDPVLELPGSDPMTLS